MRKIRSRFTVIQTVTQVMRMCAKRWRVFDERFGTEFEGKNIVMTVGAAGGLNVILKSLLNPADEVIVFAPYFGEYRSYVSNYDGVLVEVSPDTETFQPKLAEFEEKITARRKR